METKDNDVIVICSGGLDSVVAAYKLRQDGYNIRLLYLDHGKPSATAERTAALRIARKLNCYIEIIDIQGVSAMQANHVSTQKWDMDELDTISHELS